MSRTLFISFQNGQSQKIWKWFSTACPHSHQKVVCWESFFQQNSLYEGELVTDNCCIQILSHSSLDKVRLPSVSHLVFTFSLSWPFRLVSDQYNFERSFWKGASLYVFSNIWIISSFPISNWGWFNFLFRKSLSCKYLKQILILQPKIIPKVLETHHFSLF